MCVGPNKNKNHMVFVVIFVFVFSSSSLSVTLCCCCVSLSCLEFLKNLFFFSSWLSEWRAVATPILALVFPLPQQQIWLLFFSSYYKNEILSSTILRIECPFFFFSIALLLHSLTVMLSLTLPTLSLSTADIAYCENTTQLIANIRLSGRDICCCRAADIQREQHRVSVCAMVVGLSIVEQEQRFCIAFAALTSCI